MFLDLDGTLLDIAVSHDAVIVPEGLVQALLRVRAGLGGALAIVSGRTLRDIDRLLAPAEFACAAEHGAVLRFPSGRVEQAEARHPPKAWLRALQERARAWPGVVPEEKGYSIVAHYRLAPGREAAVAALVHDLVADGGENFEVVVAKKAFEIRPKGITKGLAVKLLMEVAPFRGRMPVFVGDDVTDEDGMRMARQMGGLGLHVETDFAGAPAAVRDWLGRAAATLA